MFTIQQNTSPSTAARNRALLGFAPGKAASPLSTTTLPDGSIHSGRSSMTSLEDSHGGVSPSLAAAGLCRQPSAASTGSATHPTGGPMPSRDSSFTRRRASADTPLVEAVSPTPPRPARGAVQRGCSAADLADVLPSRGASWVSEEADDSGDEPPQRSAGSKDKQPWASPATRGSQQGPASPAVAFYAAPVVPTATRPAVFNPFGAASYAPFEDDGPPLSPLLPHPPPLSPQQASAAIAKPTASAGSGSLSAAALRASPKFNPFGAAALTAYSQELMPSSGSSSSTTAAFPKVPAKPAQAPSQDLKASTPFNPFGDASYAPFGNSSDEDDEPVVAPAPAPAYVPPAKLTTAAVKASAAYNPFGQASLAPFPDHD